MKYKCKHSGSTIGKSGKYIQWTEGQTIETKDGELDHVPGLEKIEEKKKKTSKK